MSKNITKRDIIQSIVEEVDCTQVQAKAIVQMVLDSFVDALSEHHRIELRNFGVFEVKKRRPRKGMNPRTKEPVQIPGRYAVVFTPGLEMSQKVNEKEFLDDSVSPKFNDSVPQKFEKKTTKKRGKRASRKKED